MVLKGLIRIQKLKRTPIVTVHFGHPSLPFIFIQKLIGAELFEVYSFARMPIAATYKAASYFAPYQGSRI
jgi:hypothetical protein